MMERLNTELNDSSLSETLKTRKAILAKRELVKLLVKSTGEYCESFDADLKQVWDEIVMQYDSMIDQATGAICQEKTS
jgi:hypothetical protein